MAVNAEEKSALIDIEAGRSDADKGENQDIEPLKWDILYTMHYALIGLTACTFGGAYDFKYSQPILFMGYLHFGTETCLSWHFIYPRKIAKILSIITFIIYGLQAFIMVPFYYDTVPTAFGTQFVASDLLSFLCSTSVVLNKHPSYMKDNNFHLGGFAISLHFVGPSLKLYMIYYELFKSWWIPQHGLAWLLIGLVLVPQIYLTRPILNGKCNYLGEIQYAEDQKCLKIFAQIINPILSILVAPTIIFILSQLRTTEWYDYNEAGLFADTKGVFDDMILYTFWPIGSISTLYLIYVYTVKNKQILSKTQ